MERPTRMILVDDHELLRGGVKARLNTDPSIEIVGEVGTGAGALRLAEELAPDLMLLDLNLTDMSGLDVARELREKFPKIRSLVLSMYDKTGYMRQAKQAGALGYVNKNGATDELNQAIQAVSAGGTYFPHLPATNDCPLTPREIEVLCLICKGFRNERIGQILGIGIRAVQTHRLNLRQKLDLDTVAELIEYARDQALFPE